MGLRDLIRRQPLTEATVPLTEHAALANQLEVVQESLAGLEQLAREDAGWRRLGLEQQQQFTRAGLLTIQATCLAARIASPLIGRGLRIRGNYVWGQGVEITARETSTEGGEAEVNDLLQELIDSPEYQRTLGSAQAREERETDLGVRGEFFVLAVHDPTRRTVRPRLVLPAQIVDYVSNPEDAQDVWFYKRTWTTNQVALASGEVQRLERTEWHPVLDYAPARGMRVPLIQGHRVRWDQPIQHCAVNALTDAPYGIPDAYAALDWARAYAEFLTQWAVLMRSLSRFAWRATAPGAKAARVKTALTNAGTDPVTGDPRVGGTAVMDAAANLEAIPKTGATIDSKSGQPLAGMAAAALDVPVTMLLADPGQTGARAVAETLDRPLELTTGARRNLWADWIRAYMAHVIGRAVEDGRLAGRLEQDGDRQRVVLADDVAATVDVIFPPIEEVPAKDRLEAIVAADGLGTIPPLTLVRLALEALGVEDIDEVLEDLVDDNGNFIDPRTTSATAAADREQDGQGQAAEAYR